MNRMLPFFLLFLPLALAQGQIDTISYDALRNIYDGELFLVAANPLAEAEVAYNTRFTPAERCTVKGVLVGFGFVRFDAFAPDDSLVVTIYEAGTVPPALLNIVKTFRRSMGHEGVPIGNVDPAGRTNLYRDLVYVPFDVPVVIAPKRDFLIGVRFVSRQSKQVSPNGPAIWSGATLVVRRDAPEYERSRRYTIALDRTYDNNPPLSTAYRLAMFMRAVVQYDPGLPDTDPVGVAATPPVPEAAILSVAPQPFRAAADVAVSLERPSALRLTLYDALGRPAADLADGDFAAGSHSFRIDAAGLALRPGVYYLRLAAGGAVDTRAVIRIQ